MSAKPGKNYAETSEPFVSSTDLLCCDCCVCGKVLVGPTHAAQAHKYGLMVAVFIWGKPYCPGSCKAVGLNLKGFCHECGEEFNGHVMVRQGRHYYCPECSQPSPPPWRKIRGSEPAKKGVTIELVERYAS